MLKENLKYYWAVKTNSSLIHLLADSVEINQNGDLTFFKNGDQKLPLIAFSEGSWIYFYAASNFDGGACCVEIWSQDGK